jgi:hypothetical protein
VAVSIGWGLWEAVERRALGRYRGQRPEGTVRMYRTIQDLTAHPWMLDPLQKGTLLNSDSSSWTKRDAILSERCMQHVQSLSRT